MKINILPIKSYLHDGTYIDNVTERFLTEIEQLGDFEFVMSDESNFYSSEISLILVQSGGSEGYFLEIENHLKEPYLLLTFGSNNSLAASMEILSYLQSKNKKAEILHGSPEFINARLSEINSSNNRSKEVINLGVVGEPSDWLIASQVSYRECLKRLNINLVDISIDDLVEEYNKAMIENYGESLRFEFDLKEIQKAKRLSKAMDLIIKKYDLKGLTIRCFDLLEKINTTGCLGLSFLNNKKIIGTCEGDIPAMLSMYILNKVTGQPGFQANPSRINTDNNEIVFAHCTLPLDMANNYKIMTHYESGIGVAIKGEMLQTDVTIFKLSNNLKDYYVSEGRLTRNLCEENLCRTQINIKLNSVKYFLNAPYGNHHIIVYGHHKEKIIEYLRNIK